MISVIFSKTRIARTLSTLTLSTALLFSNSLQADDTIQILHASDLEGGVDAIKSAPNFAAIIEALEIDAAGDTIPSITISAGDNYIPGPFFSAAGDRSLRDIFQEAYDELFGLTSPSLTNIRESDGRADISIMNIIGFDASALGNHEFDAGTSTIGGLLGTDIRGATLGDVRWLGTQFPYLSSNLDFTSDGALSGLFTSDILANTDFISSPDDLTAAAAAPKIAQATIIDRDGLIIGVVGATTQRLPTISSPGDTNETTGGENNMAALAAVLQPVIDELEAKGATIIILASHLQQISLEEELITLLSGVDIVIAGGSDTLLADETDVLQPGAEAEADYPILTTNLDGDPAAIVSTDGEYTYVGRLVATFDDDGILLPESIDPAASGTFATLDDVVEGLWGDLEAPFAPTTKGAQVKRITDAVSGVVTAKDTNIFGLTSVYLEGRRSNVRTEETNLGNLTADANLWVAQQFDPTVVASLKNGGGIRAQIGSIDGITGELLPTAANPDAGKESGQISQLDIENAMRFNNELSLVTLSPADLKEVLENGVSGVAPGSTPGAFPQIGGMAFTYDPSAEAGSRVTSIVIKDENGLITDTVVEDGFVLGDSAREIRIVTLNFLAGGGDGYPFDTLGENRVDLVGSISEEGVADFADAGSEQDAMAEYVAYLYSEIPFSKGETAPRFDRRIQNLDERKVSGASITLNVLGTYETNIFDEGSSEIVDFDPVTQRAFVVNANAGVIDVLDISDIANPTLIAQVEQPGTVNSVAVKNGIVATAVQNDDDTLPGHIVFHDTDGNVLSIVTAGVLPDAVTFSPNGLKVLSANEGQPLNDYSVDPEGSVTIVDLGDGSMEAVSALTEDSGLQVTFEAYNDKLYSLLNKGVRIFGPSSTVAEDLEPEYIAVSPDSAYAFVTLQENNAIAVIDIEAGEAIDILPLGYKDHRSGQPVLESYTWKEENLPLLGLSTADDATPVLLGGFSGLWYAADESDANTKVFYTVPDRGPNGTSFSVDGVTNREFLLPDYQARIVKFELDVPSASLSVVDTILLTRDDGGPVPITGLPNIPGFDEVPLNGKSEAVAYDPYGGDLEGVVKHPNGTFYTVDEYRPAIYHFFADGTLNARYVPEGTSTLGDTPMAVGTYGTETLPADYALRRANRGFEAVALDPEKDVVYAFIQSPIETPDSTAIRNKSDVIRILGVDASDGTPVEEYIYLLERNADSGHGFARTDKIGDAVYAGDGKFYVLERDSSDPNSPAIGHKYIFEIDISYATNLLAEDAPAPMEGLSWEQHSADDLAAQGVRPVWKLKVTNLPTIGYLPSDKPEGLALMNDGSLAVSNDNDFTQAGFPDLTLGIIHFDDNYAFDASNRDDSITITNWPTLGMYQPDSIAAYEYDGITYLVTANEGDARDYDGYSEEERVGGLTLDESAFPNAAELQEDKNLGRLNSTTAIGDLDGDGDHDRIFSYGARSFSIWDQFGNLVFDSGDDLEIITSIYAPEDFNSTNDENGSFDNRSDDKGPEPEGLAIGTISDRTYAFIGLERVGGVVVYDITHPQNPAFVTYVNNRNFSGDAEAFTAGDLGPEGLKYVAAEDSPTNSPMLIVGNEISGTTTFYSVDSLFVDAPAEFAAGEINHDSITLTWESASDPVTIEKLIDGVWTEVASFEDGTAEWTDEGLEIATSYSYRIFARDGDTYSPLRSPLKISTDKVHLTATGTYKTNVFDEGSSEIVDYDPVTRRAYIVNADAGVIDVLDISDPTAPVKIASVEQPGSVNSVAVMNGIVATAVENDIETEPGLIVFHDTDGNVLSTVSAGVLPDNIVFSPDGLKVLTANEGEPLDDYSVDPEGSVTIVDLGDGSIASVSTLTQDNVTQVTFEAFNDKLYSLKNKGVRIFGPGSTVAQDLEPEFITAIDGFAYVTLQENNAIAVIDYEAGELLDILPLGVKDHSSGQPVLEQFTFEETDLPVLGFSTADDETPVLLGGFSGLWYAADESNKKTKVFYTIPDRGPNGTSFSVDGVTNREFLLPNYQARIVRFELDYENEDLEITDQILLSRDGGEGLVPIHGVPNIPGFDEKPLNGKSEAVDYDPYGGDMEGIVKHPNGTFYTVDEYRPAIYHFFANGTLNARYVPQGTSLLGDTPQVPGFYGTETLPADYTLRRANRGFEAVALDPEKDVVYAFIQSPIENPDSATIRNKSDVIRILGVNAADGTPVEEYIYLLERNAGSGYSFARTDKIGDAVYAGDGKFFVLERDSSNPSQPAIGHKYIFEIDITHATNLLEVDAPEPMEGLSWEQHSAEDLAAQEVKPVWKRKVTNLPTLGYLPSDKPEGLALLENGALAVSNDNDFTQAGFPDLTLGIIHFGDNNGIDASNRDEGINITNWPTLGMYMPDTIGSYTSGDQIYLVTANEGDARDYGGYSEEERVGGLTLDPIAFPDAETLQLDENLGRLNSTLADGDLDGDGDHDRIFSYGARSFTIWDRYGNLVFDSGDELEQITALAYPDDFNSTNDVNDSFDNRSDDKGPEPEGLAIGQIDDNTYLFLGLERIGGIAIYDITAPFAPEFVDYINNRDFSGDAELFTAGDLGPEGLKFITAADSPTYRPLLLVGNEVSGTTTIYDLNTILIEEADDFNLDATTSDTATIGWSEEIGDGEAIIIQRLDLETGAWVEIAQLTEESPSFTDIDLVPDSTYTYRTLRQVGDLFSPIGEEITIATKGFTGFYFGFLNDEVGTFGASITEEQTATIIVHLFAGDSVFSSEGVPVANNGTFLIETESGDILTGAIGFGDATPTAGDSSGLIEVQEDALLSVALNGNEATGSTFASDGDPDFVDLAGYFEGIVGSANATGMKIGLISPSGEVYSLIMFDGGTTESGFGMIDENGQLALVTNLKTELSGTYNDELKLFNGTFTTNDGSTGFFNYLDPDEMDVEFSTDRLINISTRVFAGTDSSNAIAGFIIEGDAPKTILIAAKGWELRDLGFTEFLLDGVITLTDPAGNVLATGDDWIDQPNADLIEATGVAPEGFYDAAIMAVLQPGAYTAIVSPKLEIDEGVAVLEVFEVNNSNADQASQLINISTRGEVKTRDAVMIGGFVIGGTTDKKVYIRSSGPSLPVDGDLLQDPIVSVRSADGSEVAFNDNWKDSDSVAAVEGTGLAPVDDAEAALVLTLSPGPYTVIVQGADGGTGIATVEIFEIEE